MEPKAWQPRATIAAVWNVDSILAMCSVRHLYNSHPKGVRLLPSLPLQEANRVVVVVVLHHRTGIAYLLVACLLAYLLTCLLACFRFLHVAIDQ